jgi:hypothetical protein
VGINAHIGGTKLFIRDISPELKLKFKIACTTHGTSMTAVIESLMGILAKQPALFKKWKLVEMAQSIEKQRQFSKKKVKNDPPRIAGQVGDSLSNGGT